MRSCFGTATAPAPEMLVEFLSLRRYGERPRGLLRNSAWSQLLRRLVTAHPRGTQPSRISWRAAGLLHRWLSVMG